MFGRRKKQSQQGWVRGSRPGTSPNKRPVPKPSRSEIFEAEMAHIQAWGRGEGNHHVDHALSLRAQGEAKRRKRDSNAELAFSRTRNTLDNARKKGGW